MEPNAAHAELSEREAIAWLGQVSGRLYRSASAAGSRQAWVAVVRAPAAGTRNGKLIVALGGSMLEATRAAESQWQQLWRGFGALH